MTIEKSLPTIAILGGTGKEGPGLAMRWVMQGYPIIIGSRKTEKALRIADELNNKLGIDSIRGMENGLAARSADICVLTVVHTAHQAAVEGLKEDLRGKILIDATARVDFHEPTPPAPPSAARACPRAAIVPCAAGRSGRTAARPRSCSGWRTAPPGPGPGRRG